jgi:hypothetical protein
MQLLLATVLIIVLSALAEYFLPWWSLAVVAFGVTFGMRLRGGRGFLAGFLAILLLWAGWALWWDIPNGQILSSRMAALFKLPGSFLFLIVTAVIGGLVGGMAGWSGALVRRAVSGT